MTLQKAALKMKEEVNKSYKGDENASMKIKERYARIPSQFIGTIYYTIRCITTTLDISITPLGLSANNFGSFILSNIGNGLMWDTPP